MMPGPRRCGTLIPPPHPTIHHPLLPGLQALR